MPNTLKDSQSNVIVGLGSYTHTAASDGMYIISAVCSEVPTSSIIITLSQSGSRSASVASPSPTAAQSTISLQKIFNVSAGDVLTVAISSSDPIDSQLNTIKTIVRIGRIG